MKNLSIIACMNIDAVIGFKSTNDLVYKISSDLKRFKEITTGHRIVMGMKTHKSMNGRLLPNRINTVVTRRIAGENISRVMTDMPTNQTSIVYIGLGFKFPKSLKFFENEEEVFIIGGAEIFQQTIDICNKMYLTVVYDSFDITDDCILFPQINFNEWKEVSRESHSDPANFRYDYDFINYERIN